MRRLLLLFVFVIQHTMAEAFELGSAILLTDSLHMHLFSSVLSRLHGQYNRSALSLP
jgi:hypothetical protein